VQTYVRSKAEGVVQSNPPAESNYAEQNDFWKALK
jgi:hypothetical protein